MNGHCHGSCQPLTVSHCSGICQPPLSNPFHNKTLQACGPSQWQRLATKASTLYSTRICNGEELLCCHLPRGDRGPGSRGLVVRPPFLRHSVAKPVCSGPASPSGKLLCGHRTSRGACLALHHLAQTPTAHTRQGLNTFEMRASPALSHGTPSTHFLPACSLAGRACMQAGLKVSLPEGMQVSSAQREERMDAPLVDGAL